MKVANKNKIDEMFALGTPIDEAINRGIQEAVRRHKQAGLPMCAWRNGQIVWIPSEELPLVEPPDQASKNGKQ
jgi:hypothetical protein